MGASVVRLGRACTAALLLSFSVVTVNGVFASCLTTLLLLVPCLLMTLLVELLARHTAPLVHRLRPALLLALVALYVFLFGAWLSNVWLIDSALQKRTLIGYALSAIVAVGVTVLARRILRMSLVGRMLLSARFWLSCSVLLGLTVSLLDTSFLPEHYWLFHVGMLGIGCSVSALVAYQLVGSVRAASWACGLALAAGAAFAVKSARGQAHDVYVTTVTHSTLQRRVLLLAREAFDRDHDGFSAVLEGGDCDDADAAAYPLSLKGRDCLGWIDPRQGSRLRALPDKSADHGPLLIVLVTVDALRCHDVVPGELDFREACSNLAALGREGRSRDDAHTTFPSTGHAIGALHSAKPFFRRTDNGRGFLAAWMGEQGRYTHAISTHMNQMLPVIAHSFQSVDTDLQAVALAGSSVTSSQVTDRTLRAVDQAVAGNRKTFLWSHYYDPHAPYVATPGSPWAISSNRERYLVEVRRVDSELKRLAQGIAARTDSALVLITADHGEEFEEKAARNHGATLDEAATRVPMVLWSPSHSLLPMHADMPASLVEVAPFLASLVSGDAFVSLGEAFFWTSANTRRIVGLYADGKKVTYNESLNLLELFDVTRDIGEVRNLAAEQPQLRQMLGARLARYLVSQAGHADASDD